MAVWSTPSARELTVGPVPPGFARIVASSCSFHRRTTSSSLHGGFFVSASGQPLTGKVLTGGAVVVVGLAASAGGVVVVTEKVATTTPATTRRMVANLYFIHSSLSTCASSRYGHGPPARLKTSTLVPAPAARTPRDRIVREDHLAAVPTDPGAAHEVQVRTPRRESNRKAPDRQITSYTR